MTIAHTTITLNQHELDTITTALRLLAGNYRDQAAQSRNGAWSIDAIMASTTRDLADRMQRYGEGMTA